MVSDYIVLMDKTSGDTVAPISSQLASLVGIALGPSDKPSTVEDYREHLSEKYRA